MSGGDLVFVVGWSCIDGGNTFQLMHILRRSHQDTALALMHQDGAVVYGMSAGAIILGADIRIAAHFDDNEVVLDQLQGLKLLENTDVWPHYTPAHRDQVAETARRTGTDILAVPEDGAALIRDQWYSVGRPATLFLPRPTGQSATVTLDPWPGHGPACGAPNRTAAGQER
ncbi:MAG TPA: Type 1 glutamine amidotransferase-like domain-containing protein [Actinocrinis sp.]|nr:Type 1 glutamine amidotransferase-like domain-containing protein [Actinocrinis sp.]